MTHKLAITHASGLLAEAILERLPESGLTPDSVVLLDDEHNLGKRISYAGKQLICQDQNGFDFSEVDIVFLLEDDNQLADNLQQQNPIVVSHLDLDQSAPVYLAESSGELDLPYHQKIVRLLDAESSCLIDILMTLQKQNSLQSINVTSLRGADFYGRKAVNELASQTVSLLNGRGTDPSFYSDQIAFNVLPKSLAGHNEISVVHCLTEFDGDFSYQIVDVPVLHGLTLSIELQFAKEYTKEQVSADLAKLENLEISNDHISPVSDSNQSFSCILSHLYQDSEGTDKIRFWMVVDSLRYGLSKNYVNVAGFLLKSFL